jgi:hypothetical protein
VSDPLVALAQAEHSRGRAAQAVPLAERAVSLAMKGRPPRHAAEARFVLARALWDASADEGPDRARAMALAEQARDGLRDGGEVTAEKAAEIDAWLGEHASPG